MKFISSSNNMENIDKKETFEVSLNKIGRPVSREDERVFAKAINIVIDGTNTQSKYAILVHNNQPYDPYGTDSHRESTLRLELKNVNAQTHNYYISYLRTKNSLYMTKAQRSFING